MNSVALPVMALGDFHDALKSQGVPIGHEAVKCPVCRTVQSFTEFKAAHDAADAEVLRKYFGSAQDATAEKHFGFSCIGRYTQAGPWSPDMPPGGGCNWTLGGFFHAERLLVEMPDGARVPAFEPATPEEAQQRMREART